MGRRKITIKQIADPKLRHITFNKRKNGLIKKAAELSLLCNVNMLLIFEDGNGNLIQFSKNKIQNIPAFFQECNYNNVLDFSAKDYPTFFKVNHYKKHKERETDSYDGDDVEFGGESSSKNYSTGPSGRSNNKRERISNFNHIKEEDQESHVIYQSGSEESDNEEDLDMNVYSDYVPQRETAPIPQQKKNNMMKSKPTKQHKTEEKSRIPSNENQITVPVNNEQETPKESFQSYKETNQRQNNFAAPFISAEQSFNRPNPANVEQTNQSFRFYPTDNNNMPAPNTNSGFVSNTNFGNNLPYLNNNAFQTAPNQNNFQNQKKNMLRGFGNLNMGQMNPMANMANMAGMANMGQKGNEEAFNAMFKGFPIGFAIGGANPFITKNNNKPEIDEKVLETAHMIKYLNNAAPNGYGGQKMYNFRPENGKNEEVDPIAHLRNNEHGGVVYDGEGDYSEMPAYVRGDYRIENAIPSNLPSAYFSSKKFNFDGYFNNFEEDRYNEYAADQKKKLKQMN